jgi:hypothetical protein
MAGTPPASVWRKVFEGTREINTLIGPANPGLSAFPLTGGTRKNEVR